MKRLQVTSRLITPAGINRSYGWRRKSHVAALAIAASLPFVCTASGAEFTWTNLAGGTQSWDDPANWGGAGFPSVIDDKADLSVNLAGHLTANIPASGVTVATLSLGATAAPVSTTIAGGTLSFDISSGAANIRSGGVVGATNLISAAMVLNDNLDIDATSTNSLTLGGSINCIGGARTITNRMTGGPQLLFTGTINLFDATDPATARDMGLGGVAGATNVYNASFVSSTGGSGGPNFSGEIASNGALFTTHYLRQASPNLGAAYITRGTVVVGDDLAFGTAVISMNAGHRTHIQSDHPSRTLSNNISITNGFTVDGNNSLTLNGWIIQQNNRAMVNNLAPGSTLTLTGAGNGVSIYIFESTDPGNRTFIIDGRGNTVVQGQIRNDDGPDNTGAYNLTKRGSGTLTLTNTTSTWAGQTNVNGGLLVFAAANTWGNTSAINVNANGGVWYAPGSADAGFAAFIGKIASTSVGALAIPAAEAASNFDFSASGALAGVASMSIGAQGAVTYSGTVTPGVNGYFWGGMTGTLTLNGDDRMTGANRVTYRNGGKVIVNGLHSYTGITTIAGANLTTGENRADRRDSDRSSDTENIFTSTVLEISSIADGGVASALGASTSDAANLVFNGGTLRYVGAAGASDRLFSIGTFGATIDSSGSGPLNLSNSGAIVAFGNGNRALTLTGSNGGNNTLAATLADAGAASLLSVVKTGPGKWILSGANTYTGGTSVNAGTLVATRLANGTITVNANAVAQISTKGTANSPAGTSRTASLNLAASARLDLNNNSLIINSGSLATVTSQIKSALENGGNFDWLGPGIGSTQANVQNTTAGSFLYGLGVILNDLSQVGGSGPIYTDFAGVSGLVGTEVLVKFTYFGDADLSGSIDATDYSLIDNGYVNSLTGWLNGDFDYSGSIDATDYALIDNAYVNQVGPLGEALIAEHARMLGGEYLAALRAIQSGVIPEPAAIGLLLGGATILTRRRRPGR
ncbi:MAG TPA: autotransporter-associated beta strand repeat-containing protein [Tepidisphaeraceae bacterium]|nr:autotransporter-associated beta strand repeat-containing protein [Tepidisphaeraceae bacterium]